MTQTPRTPVKWIVPVPENDPFGRRTFATACRGNADIGSVLNYFVYDASRQVEREEIDISKIEYVTLENRLLDAIVQRTGVSRKTLIAHIKKLEEWKLLVADAYRHRYDVYFKNVTKDILHPPEEIKPKLRGIHVAKCRSTLSTLSPEITVEEFRQMQEQIVNLQSESVNLHFTIVNLQSEMVKLQSLQSSKGASQQGLNPVFDTPNSSNSNQEREESSDAPFVASPPSPSFSSETDSHPDTTSYSQADYNQQEYSQSGNIPSIPENVTQASSDMAGVHGYEKEVDNESSTDSIWDRDAGGIARDSDLLPAPERPFTRGTQDQAARQTQTAQVTQQTPLLQAREPVLSGDAREESDTPPRVAPLLLSHTLQGTSLLGDLSLDALLTQPPRRIDAKALLAEVRGQATETIRASADTSLEVASDTTNDAVQESTTMPASSNKTVQVRKNKKSRGKSTEPEKPVVPVEPDPLTVEERELFDAWNSIFDAEVPLGPKTIEVVQWLNRPIRTWAGLLDLSLKATLEDERRWCYANDSKGYYKKRGVRLYNLKDDFEGWQSMKQEELRKKREQEKTPPSGGGTNGIRPTISGKRRLDVDEPFPLAAARSQSPARAWVS